MRRIGLIAIVCVTVVLMSGLLVSAAQAEGAPVKYIVKPGDTLYRIAVQHSVPVTQLAAANYIYNPSYIRAGQVLTIPGDHPAIKISAPAWGADAPSPLIVSGQSDTFEGRVFIRVLDSAYRVVGTGSATGGSNGAYGDFSVSVTYTVRLTQTGIVEAYFKSAKDGSVMGQADARVRLTTATSGPVPPPGPRIHIVQSGENLYRISLRYHTTVQAIAQANNIANVNLIYVGQRLVIP